MQKFVEVPNIKFHKYSSGGSRADACGQTDGQTDIYDEANRSFSLFKLTRLKRRYVILNRVKICS